MRCSAIPIRGCDKVKMLELFAGTSSVGRVFKAHGWEVYTVDWDEQFDVTLHADIGSLTAEDCIELCGGRPDVIWASPDCTTYSVMAISHHREREPNGNLRARTEYAQRCDTINTHVVQLIKDLNPKYWFIENPVGGLRKMDFMAGLPRYTVTYCFTHDVEIITKEGVKLIGDCCDTIQTLLTSDGWKDAKIQDHGIQPIFELKLTRAGKKKTIRTTKEHIWYVGGKEIKTINLKSGMRLDYCEIPKEEDLHIIPEYVARGFVFGDGYTLQRLRYSLAQFCNEKKEIMPYYDGLYSKCWRDDKPGIEIWKMSGLPKYWKTEMLGADATPSEKYSWIAGYFAADGTVGIKNGQVTISSSCKEHLQCVQDRLREIGIDSYDITEYWRKGYNDYETPLYQLTIMRSMLSGDFFIRKKHKDNFLNAGPIKHQAKKWTVQEIVETGISEQVYCADVPDVHNFALNGGILTHNCQYGETRQKPTDLWTNHPDPQFKPPCKRGSPCHEAAPRGSKCGTQKINGKRDRARIPVLLCEHIYNICQE